MARPRYENNKTLKMEKEIIQHVANKINYNYQKLPESHILDFALLEKDTKDIKFFVEVKRRYCNMNKYPTIFVSMHKILKAKEVYEAFNIKTFFIIQWNDTLGYVFLNDPPDFLTMEGRYDRNDKDDIEPMGNYDISRVFTITDSLVVV